MFKTHVSKKTAGEVDGVDVECVGTSLAQGGLHALLGGSSLVDVVEPVRVDSGLTAGEVERESSTGVSLVHDRDLAVDLGRSQLTVGAIGDDVVVDGDAGRGEGVARVGGLGATSRCDLETKSLLNGGGRSVVVTADSGGGGGHSRRSCGQSSTGKDSKSLELHLYDLSGVGIGLVF